MSDRLIIERRNDGCHIVHSGDKWAELSRDESLWAVAQWLIGKDCQYMRTTEQWEEWEESMKRSIETSIGEAIRDAG